MDKALGRRWAEFRHSVIGHLLAAPPADRGSLQKEVIQLAAKSWTHPVKNESVKFGFSTIERWYYQARREKHDVVGALNRKRRDDANRSLMKGQLKDFLDRQYTDHPGWTAMLHADNLGAKCREAGIRRVPSYQTVRRYLRATGKQRIKRCRPLRSGEAGILAIRENREIRSFEASHVGGLLHLDFHRCGRKIITADGSLLQPLALAVIDDHSRLICHIQWYLSETTRDLVHGFSQAILRRGLPRALMTDNGSAMISGEFTEGLRRLGIIHQTTLAYSPHQNGKIESFWGQLEGRLIAMLEREAHVRLELLNRATLAWVEMEYHRSKHSEIDSTPMERFLSGPSVMRDKISSEELRRAFRCEEKRKPRRSDGTLTVEGVRYEIPDRFRHLQQVHVRFARWDLSQVDLVCPATETILATLTPLDKSKNADAKRRRRGEVVVAGEPSLPHTPGIAPLLSELMSEYAATGLPPAYISQNERT